MRNLKNGSKLKGKLRVTFSKIGVFLCGKLKIFLSVTEVYSPTQ